MNLFVSRLAGVLSQGEVRMSRSNPAAEEIVNDTASTLERVRGVRPQIEKQLMEFHKKYKQRSPGGDHAILAIELQITMFQYELVREFELLFAHEAQGFARAVAIKGLIHRLVEFDKHLRDVIIPEMLKYAEGHGIMDFERKVRDLQRDERPNLAVIRSWQDIRNKATGHYDRDLQMVVELLEAVDPEKTRDVTEGFMIFMLKLLMLLRVVVVKVV